MELPNTSACTSVCHVGTPFEFATKIWFAEPAVVGTYIEPRLIPFVESPLVVPFIVSLYVVFVPDIVITPLSELVVTLPEPLIWTFPLFAPPPTNNIYGFDATVEFAVPPVAPAYNPSDWCVILALMFVPWTVAIVVKDVPIVASLLVTVIVFRYPSLAWLPHPNAVFQLVWSDVDGKL